MTKPIDQGFLLNILLSIPVLIVITLISIIGLGFWTPLFDLDEGAFAEATREMLVSGNWVSTYLNGEPRHDKPILIYWLQALSVSVFGVNSFAFRLPSVLAALGWIYLVFGFVREFFSARAAAICVWVMASTALVSVIGKASTADALLNLLLTASFFQIFRFWHRQTLSGPTSPVYTRKNCGHFALLGVLLGLGFLTKGPVAIALPITTALIAMLLKGNFILWLKAVTHPASVIMFTVVILPWHVAVYLDQGWSFFEGFYLGHNLARFNSTMENHGGSPFYYVLLFPVLLLPFTRQFFVVLANARGKLNDCLPPIYFYFCIWFLLTLGLFSFSQTQLPHYLLYGLVPVFIVISVNLAKIEQCHKLWDCLFPALALLLFSWLPLALPNIAESEDGYNGATAQAGWQAFSGGLWIIAAIITVLGLFIYFYKSLNKLSKALCLGFLSICACNFVLLPTISAGQQQPVHKIATIVNMQYPNAHIVAYKTNMPSFSVYTQRIVNRDQPNTGDLIILKIDKVEKLQRSQPGAEFSEITRSAGLALYRRDS